MLDLGYFKMQKVTRGYKVSFTTPGSISMRVVSRLNHPSGYNDQLINNDDTRNSALSGSQINQILRSLIMSGIVLAYRLFSIDLRDVPEDLLVFLVLSCRELSISKTNLSTSQLSAILQAIQRSDNLEELELKEKNLKDITAQGKAACIASLKTVLLDDFSNNIGHEEENKSVNRTKSEESFSAMLLQGR